MRIKPPQFFIRQNITLRAKPKPSNDPDIIRIKFLEKAYISYKKLPAGFRVMWKSIAVAAIVPFVIYQMILFFIRYDHKVKIYLIIFTRLSFRVQRIFMIYYLNKFKIEPL